MTDLYKQYKEFGITENVFKYCENVLGSLEERFKAIDKNITKRSIVINKTASLYIFKKFFPAH